MYKLKEGTKLRKLQDFGYKYVGNYNRGDQWLKEINIIVDGKHSGIVTKIEPVIENGEYDFKISINEGREYKEYTDSIHNFIIF